MAGPDNIPSSKCLTPIIFESLVLHSRLRSRLEERIYGRLAYVIGLISRRDCEIATLEFIETSGLNYRHSKCSVGGQAVSHCETSSR